LRAAATLSPARRSDVAVTNFCGTGQVQRWLPIVAAGALAAYVLQRGLKRRRPEKGTGYIADRHSDTRQKLGGSRGIHVEHSVVVHKGAAQLFRYWRNLENLPKFMQHLEAVSVREGGVSHWVARGPAGMKVEWDARIINEVEDKVIGWQSLTGSDVSTAGAVTFDETERGTVVRVHMQYSPPGGRLGAAIAFAFGEEPNLQVQEDLRRFKSLMETGAVPTTDYSQGSRIASQ
jgi:uncharacterized membrane protein